MTHAILSIFLSIFQPLSPASSSEIFDYCDMFECEISPWSPAECTEMRGVKTCCIDDDCWTLEPLKFCCHPSGACVLTSALSNCDPDDYLVICEWGLSNPDGSIECYD